MSAREPPEQPNRTTVHWQPRTPSTRAQLLCDMDSSLVAVALCDDVADNCPWDLHDCRKLIKLLPQLPAIVTAMESAMDDYCAARKQPGGKGEIATCAGIYTKGDHTGRGFGRALSHRLMHEMARRGFYRMGILSLHPTLSTIWDYPPAPYRAWVAAVLNTAGCPPPLNLADVECKRIFVALSERPEDDAVEAVSSLGGEGMDEEGYDSSMWLWDIVE